MVALFGYIVETERGEEHYVLPEACQSAGTNRMVELESLIYSLLQRQGLLCVDEIESSMHLAIYWNISSLSLSITPTIHHSCWSLPIMTQY